ncbi:DUF1129 family protein [Virgibacillus necropolis]|uniref:DUF1129 domain-containing protein n=1 Tax=Virgibacillus necropolis TaxID=163877 RepID=A0A221MHI0_9BACI|nr:DUF1129 family protein [Virgibacillus necropolis]ASN07118.1 hypothetical protein CFK40_20000 [Virgibacillus necropolis]
MNSKDIIRENNEKRKLLNEENLAYYQDMLVYIRLNGGKSEQATEEVLLELLEHLIQAQEEGKSAVEIFGDDPKDYSKAIIKEIPNESNTVRIPFIAYIVVQFLAIISLVNGIVGSGMYYFFELGSSTTVVSLGSGFLIVCINLFLLYLFITFVLKWIKRSTDKKPNKWLEFLQLWLISVVMIGTFIAVSYFMPGFGSEIRFPTIAFAGIGIALYLISYMMNKKLRLTK